MVRVYFSAQGNVVDFEYDKPDGSYADNREECSRCGEFFDPEYSGNYAGVCKSCWKELNAAMRQGITRVLNDFSPAELKLLDEWGNPGDIFLDCMEARIKQKGKK
jgi:hypothetical protein